MKVIPTVIDNPPAWMQRDISKLSDAKRGTLTRFLREMKLKGFSLDTIEGYVRVIRSLGYDGKPYEELTSDDLMAWMERIGSNGWSAETVNWHRRKVKHFLRWLHGCKSVRDPTPEPLKCIQQHRTKQELPKGILSRGEIRQLIDACENQRNRALVFATFDSGGRAGEMLNMKIEDLQFDRFGVALRLSGKTGERRVYCVECTPDLRLWLSMHPSKGDANAPLWPSPRRSKGGLSRDGFEILLGKLGKKALNKHVYPHLLRHSSATYYSTFLTEPMMKIRYGWSKNSRMPDLYNHLSGKQVDDKIRERYGIKIEGSTKDLLEPKTCPWCQTVNSPSARFCQQCNAPLDSASATKAVEKQRRRMELVDRFIERVLQEIPDKGENYLREMRKELVELAD